MQRLERRVFGGAQPLKRHHFSCHQLGPVARQAVKGGVAVALGAGAAGIGSREITMCLENEVKAEAVSEFKT